MTILDVFLANVERRTMEKLAEENTFIPPNTASDMSLLEKATLNPRVSDTIDYLNPEDNVLMGTLQGMGNDIVENTDINSYKANSSNKVTTDNWGSEDFQKRRLLTKKINNELSKGPDLTWLERFSNSAPVSKFLDFYEGSLPDQMVNSVLSGEADKFLGNLGEKAYNIYNYFSEDTQDPDKIMDDFIDHSLSSNFRKQRVATRAQSRDKLRSETAKKLFLNKGITPEALMHNLATQAMPSVRSLKDAIKYIDTPVNIVSNIIRNKVIRDQMNRAKIEAERKSALSQQASQGLIGRLWNGVPKTYTPDYSKVNIPPKIKKDVLSDLVTSKYRDLLHTMRGNSEQSQPVNYSNVIGDMFEGMGQDAGFRSLFNFFNGDF